jgi:hypothetical protein
MGPIDNNVKVGRWLIYSSQSLTVTWLIKYRNNEGCQHSKSAPAPLPSLSAKQKDPGPVFSITTNGPVHLGSSFLEVSMRGLHSKTRCPGSMCFSLTFLSLHALISLW